MRDVNDVKTMQVTRSFAMSADACQGALICVRGNAIGSMFTLQNDRKVLVGRDPALCGLVLSDPKVSRKHLEITYVGALNKYRVVDHSSNGTYLANGSRLHKGREHYLEPAAELWLGSEAVRYRLR